jgi:Asp-tRNA(Asn)/Glu-tRNA(Gln) amidotransferase C subunit
MVGCGMDIEELRITAALAHINFNEDELAKAFPSFTEMLSFFELMQSADGVDNEAAASDSTCFRADVSAGCPETLIEKAAETDGRFIVIPNVL